MRDHGSQHWRKPHGIRYGDYGCNNITPSSHPFLSWSYNLAGSCYTHLVDPNPVVFLGLRIHNLAAGTTEYTASIQLTPGRWLDFESDSKLREPTETYRICHDGMVCRLRISSNFWWRVFLRNNVIKYLLGFSGFIGHTVRLLLRETCRCSSPSGG